MEVSGVQRLLAYARELGVEASRPGRNAAPSVETPASAKRTSDDSGLRLSLSPEALERVDAPRPERGATTTRPTAERDAERPAQGSALDAYRRQAESVRGGTITLRA